MSDLGRWIGDRFIAYQGDYNGEDWMLTSIDGEGEWIITTDHRKADETITNSQLAPLLAASPTLYHAAKIALDAILNSRPESVALTDKEKKAVRWLRSAVGYAETNEWLDPEPYFQTADKGNAPMLSFNHKRGSKE